MQEHDFNRACALLVELAQAVQRYGVSSSGTESLLVRVARALHIRAQFLVTPTQVQSIVWEGDGDRQQLHISVASAASYDMARLAQINELVEQIESGQTTPDAGLDRIREIERTDPEYGPGLDAVMFALCGLAFGVILGISWLDALLGGVLSIVSFGIARLAANSPGLATALELVVAAVATALATLLALVLPGSNALAVAVCAFIYFVPGFGLTLGASELMGGNTLSGLIGFTRAAVTAMKLVLGTLIGTALVGGWTVVPKPNVDSGVPEVWTWLFAPMLVLCLAVLFRVRRRDLVWPLLVGLSVWASVEAGASLGTWQGTFIGAFIVSFASLLFARLTRLPAAIIVLPAVMLLVPGVPALRAIYVGQTLGLVEGLRSASDVLVLIAAILGGVVLGEAVWSIRQAAASAVASEHSRKGRGH